MTLTYNSLETRHIDLPTGKLAYHVMGNGPTLVLIPSLGRGAEDFDELVPFLCGAGFRVLLPEPRGIGGSAPLAEGDTLFDMAADIAAVIEHEKAAPAILAGHAAGNWVARVLAHDRPDLATAVVLLAAIVTDMPPAEIRSSITASFDMSLTDELRRGHLARVYFAPGADASVWLGGWWPEVAKAQRRAATLTRNPSWKRVANRFPTLYIGAADDVISPPPSDEALKEALGPLATAVVIDNAGHALLPEQPEAVASTLVTWISRLN